MAALVRTLRCLRASNAPLRPATGVLSRWISSEAPKSSAAAVDVASAAAVPEAPKVTVVNHPVTTDAITAADYFAVIKLGGTQYKVTQVGGLIAISHCVLCG